MYLIIKKVKYKNNIIYIFILVNNAKKEKKKHLEPRWYCVALTRQPING